MYIHIGNASELHKPVGVIESEYHCRTTLVVSKIKSTSTELTIQICEATRSRKLREEKFLKEVQ